MATYSYGMIQTTDDTVIDCTKYEILSGLEVDCDIPNKTKICFLFSSDGSTWKKYDVHANEWTDFTGELKAENIVENGNTVGEVQGFGLAAMNAFCGKKIHFAVGMRTSPDQVSPSIRSISLVDNTVPCGEVQMGGGEPAELVGIVVGKKEVGDGRVKVLASVQDSDGNWTSYREYKEYLLNRTRAKAIKFRAAYSVQNIGPDSAELDSIHVQYAGRVRKGEVTSVCTTKAFSFPHPVTCLHMILKHPEAKDIRFQPYVALRNSSTGAETWIPMNQDSVQEGDSGLLVDEFDYTATEEQAGSIVTLRVDIEGNTGSVTNQVLGTGNGVTTRFQLEHHPLQDTITVSPADAAWNYHGKDRSIDITARIGEKIIISYDWMSEMTYLDSMSCVFSE